jgi:hypothetical protein
MRIMLAAVTADVDNNDVGSLMVVIPFLFAEFRLSVVRLLGDMFAEEEAEFEWLLLLLLADVVEDEALLDEDEDDEDELVDESGDVDRPVV